MVYMITYDLNAPGQDYSGLIATINECSTGNIFSAWKSSYLIQSNLTVEKIMEKINPHMDRNDNLIVIEVTNNYSGWLNLEDGSWDKVKNLF